MQGEKQLVNLCIYCDKRHDLLTVSNLYCPCQKKNILKVD